MKSIYLCIESDTSSESRKAWESNEWWSRHKHKRYWFGKNRLWLFIFSWLYQIKASLESINVGMSQGSYWNSKTATGEWSRSQYQSFCMCMYTLSHPYQNILIISFPSQTGFKALILASRKGYHEIVGFLLDPTINSTKPDLEEKNTTVREIWSVLIIILIYQCRVECLL